MTYLHRFSFAAACMIAAAGCGGKLLDEEDASIDASSDVLYDVVDGHADAHADADADADADAKPDAPICPPGTTQCGSACVDTVFDPNNCGGCGVHCPSGICNNGACAPCPNGLTSCGGGCYDLQSDPAHCGSCSTQCSSNEKCLSGHCCGAGLSWCTSACVDTSTDPSNCGACGSPCGPNQVCSGGKCCGSPPPPGACAHSLCIGNTATPLASGCDPTGCVSTVCVNDPYCCQTAWDSICVDEVQTYCQPYTCSGC